MSIEEMRRKKDELGYSCEWIADQTGVPISTVRKIFSGETKRPRRETIASLESLFGSGFRYDIGPLTGTRIAEPTRAYASEDKKYTITDYNSWPDTPRVELIDGKAYAMSSPSQIHQVLLLDIASQFRNYIDLKKKSCQVFVAPIDVQPDAEDDTTIVQPDILIVCDDKKTKNPARIIGAPDLTVEILSPGSRKHDCLRKKKLYEKTGVKEYWIVDPEAQMVTTYTFENPVVRIFSFQDLIPVALAKDGFTINLKKFYTE